MLAYSRSDLLAWRQPVASGCADILHPIGYPWYFSRCKKNKRGKRAGCRKQTNIPVRIGPFVSNVSNTKSTRSVNHENLVSVNLLSDKVETSSCQINGINLGLINAQSVRGKIDVICDHVIDHKLDILCLPETWLSASRDARVISELTLPGYKFMHVDRRGRGGGVAILYKSSYDLTVISSEIYASFESVQIKLTSNPTSLQIVVIYRPPPSKKKLNAGIFFEEFEKIIEKYADGSDRTLIVGDFTFHIDVDGDTNEKKIISMIQSMNFTQHVLEPTHTSGHILDLLVTPKCTSFVRSVEIAVHCQLEIHKPPPKNKTVSFRKFKAIARSEFRCDIVNSNLNESSSVDLDDMVSNYNSTTATLIDKHAPLVSRCIPIKQTFPWYSDNIAHAKRDRRRAEPHCCNTGLEIHHEIFKDHRENVNKLITHSKSNNRIWERL